MENQTKPNEQYGKILEGFFLRQHVGDATTPDGKSFELATSMQMSPILIYKNRAYALSWNDIYNMANAAGLFDDKEADNEKNI